MKTNSRSEGEVFGAAINLWCQKKVWNHCCNGMSLCFLWATKAQMLQQEDRLWCRVVCCSWRSDWLRLIMKESADLCNPLTQLSLPHVASFLCWAKSSWCPVGHCSVCSSAEERKQVALLQSVSGLVILYKTLSLLKSLLTICGCTDGKHFCTWKLRLHTGVNQYDDELVIVLTCPSVIKMFSF